MHLGIHADARCSLSVFYGANPLHIEHQASLNEARLQTASARMENTQQVSVCIVISQCSWKLKRATNGLKANTL